MAWIRNWFSNMKPLDTPFEYEGLKYKTVENFYQAMKAKFPDDRQMLSEMDPYEAKRVAKEIVQREDWEGIKLPVMFLGLYKKFGKGTSWRAKLDREKGEIVETNNWHDNFWGNCICERCKDIPGENNLGKMLMFIRDKIHEL